MLDVYARIQEPGAREWYCPWCDQVLARGYRARHERSVMHRINAVRGASRLAAARRLSGPAGMVMPLTSSHRSA